LSNLALNRYFQWVNRSYQWLNQSDETFHWAIKALIDYLKRIKHQVKALTNKI